MDEYDVIIIGGGISGLAAAKQLRESNIRYIVLESRNRLGGRIYTKNYENGQFKLDIGASWIGPTQTRMLELSKELNIDYFPQYDKGKSTFAFQGKKPLSFSYIGFALLLPMLLFFLKQSIFVIIISLVIILILIFFYEKFPWVKDSYQILRYKGIVPPIWIHSLGVFFFSQLSLDKLAKTVNLDKPWMTPNANYLDSLSLGDWAKQNLTSPIILNAFEAGCDAIFGKNINEISLLFALFYIKSAGNIDMLLNVEGGAQQYRIQNGTQEFVTKMSQNINYKLDQAVSSIQADEKKEHLIINTSSKQYLCKRVIIAVPPQVAAEQINFNNLISQNRIQMMKEYKMGNINKVWVVYNKPFWRELGYNALVVCPNEVVSTVFDGSPNDSSKGMLLGFCVRDKQTEFFKKDKETRKNIIINTFAKFFGQQALQPIYYEDESFSEEQWSIGCPTGSYQKGILTKYQQDLKQQCNNIYWASTEVATRWNGFMEGAVLAAEKAVKEIRSSFI